METISFTDYRKFVSILFKEVTLILDKLEIPWWIHSGSLLGLIRHNGEMIPWDDDIDIMVPSNLYREKIEIIQKELWEKKIKLIDWTFGQYDIKSDAWFAKVFFNKEFMIISDDGKKISPTPKRPFIDIFYAVPSDSFKREYQWKKYQLFVKLQWVVRPGFNRFLSARNNKKKTFFMNLISYPVKLFIPKRIIHNYLWIPYENLEGNWKLLRRADPWASRKVIYNLDNGLIEGKFLNSKVKFNKDWENELINSYGNNWNAPIWSLPHVYQNISANWERGYQISKILDDTFKL